MVGEHNREIEFIQTILRLQRDKNTHDAQVSALANLTDLNELRNHLSNSEDFSIFSEDFRTLAVSAVIRMLFLNKPEIISGSSGDAFCTPCMSDLVFFSSILMPPLLLFLLLSALVNQWILIDQQGEDEQEKVRSDCLLGFSAAVFLTASGASVTLVLTHALSSCLMHAGLFFSSAMASPVAAVMLVGFFAVAAVLVTTLCLTGVADSLTSRSNELKESEEVQLKNKYFSLDQVRDRIKARRAAIQRMDCTFFFSGNHERKRQYRREIASLRQCGYSTPEEVRKVENFKLSLT